jgi:hypothetical protein
LAAFSSKDVRAADDAVHCVTVALTGLALKVYEHRQVVTHPSGYRLKHDGPAPRESTARPIQTRLELGPALVDATPGSHDRYVVIR